MIIMIVVKTLKNIGIIKLFIPTSLEYLLFFWHFIYSFALYWWFGIILFPFFLFLYFILNATIVYTYSSNEGFLIRIARTLNRFSYVFIPQAIDKRGVVPAPVNAGGTVKLIPSTQTAGKLGFHVGSGSTIQTSGMLPSKKPPVSRGVPPPVPPNKPVVPPKKEAAYIRRTESQTTQDAVKLGKQAAAHPTSGSPAPQIQQAIGAFTQSSDEEVSNKAPLPYSFY